MTPVRLQALLLLAFLLAVAHVPAAGATLQVQFYGKALTLPYDPGMVVEGSLAMRPSELASRYRALERTPYNVLLDALLAQQKAMRLNDWLFYRLMHQAVAELIPDNAPARHVTCWLLLAKCGYDVRLFHTRTHVFIYGLVEEGIFEAPIISDGGKEFVNLTDIDFGEENRKPMGMVSFVPNPNGRPFSFSLRTLPDIRAPRKVEVHLQFPHRGRTHNLNVEADGYLKDLMSDYPTIDEGEYLETPLSPTLQASLLPQLRPLLAGKTDGDAVALLVAFTRSAFTYREDKEFFGYSKPFIPDELFLYPVSDCEDRCALFFQLVKTLLDLPMLAIAYDDHLSMAVALQHPPTHANAVILHEGRQYYMCDPTGPSGSDAVGQWPYGYEQKPYEILHEYK